MKYFVAEVQHGKKGKLLYAKKNSRVHTSVEDRERKNMGVSLSI